MTTYQFGPLEVSRATALAMVRADEEFRREQREREAAAEARREQAEGQLRRYYAENHEWPHETMARQQAIAAQREQRELQRREQERCERQAAYTASLLASGRRPRSIEEVLEIARLAP